MVPSRRDASPFDDELSLADYARLLRRWWWLAIAILLVVVGGVATVTLLQAPTYEASSTVLIRTASSGQLFALGGRDVPGRMMAAEADFLTSTEYLTEARVAAGNNDEVDIDVGDIAARVEPSIITFTASSPTPERSAATAQAWAETYIDLRHDIDLADAEATLASLEATRDALDEERRRVAGPIERLDEQIAEADDAATASELSAQRVALVQTLNAQLQPIDTQLATVNTDLAEHRLLADLLTNPAVSARVNTDAEVPTGPASPQPVRNLALGAVVGAILAVAAVVAVASFDDRLRTTDDVEAATPIGSLATVPYGRTKKLPLDLAPGSLTEEAFQRIVSAIDFAKAAGQAQKVLLVTSPQPGEGKTSTATRLAMALANEKRNVLIVGGDLRRPTLAQAVGTESGPGLADYLTSDTALDGCLHRVTWRRHLVAMPAGEIRNDHNPAEVLRSAELAALIEKLSGYCDHIIIDGPPLLPVVDALELAAVSDAVLLSLFARRSRGRAVQRALRLLDEAGPSTVLGYVLNGVHRGEQTYGGRY
ncbi:MAG: polysaccharide biosynthesis tyrosine autokinase [Acidimicrobiales bacterium]